jgi:hypothetical protein
VLHVTNFFSPLMRDNGTKKYTQTVLIRNYYIIRLLISVFVLINQRGWVHLFCRIFWKVSGSVSTVSLIRLVLLHIWPHNINIKISLFPQCGHSPIVLLTPGLFSAPCDTPAVISNLNLSPQKTSCRPSTQAAS